MGHDKEKVSATSQLVISEEDDLDVVWPRIIQACNADYDWNLNYRARPGVDDVLAEFKPVKKDNSSVQENAKAVFRNSLVIIERFGAIAAQGAGMVFGPSQQCFNAVSFVIKGFQDYHEAMGNIATLMERVSVFLETLQMYLDQKKKEGRNTLDKRLRVSVYRVLQHFLTILGIWHKMTQKTSGKFKLALKVVVFGEDGGVKSAMSKLEQLVLDVTNAKITDIQINLSQAARNIEEMEKTLDQIGETVGRIENVSVRTGETVSRIENAAEKTVTSLGRLETAKDDEKRLKDIRDALGLTEKRPWEVRQAELRSQHIDGTGSWLLNDYKPFLNWSEVKESSYSSVLSLKAKEGFGKSHLCSAVINHLLNSHRGNARVGIAYYFFQKDDFSSGKLAINPALKSVIYQLASSPTPLGKDYAKFVQKACERKPDFGQSGELWKHLVTDAKQSLDGTFFIILDGIDEAESEPANPLTSIIEQLLADTQVADERQLATRMFLAGRPLAIDSLEKRTIPEIPLQAGDETLRNAADILLYAQSRLANMDLFRSDMQQVQDLMERAKTVLGKGARGDYYVLNIKLDQIEESHSTQEVEAILETAEESREDITAREVKRLNEALSIAEIKEVNELLVWVPVSFGDPSIKLCEDILRPMWKETGLLGSLEKRIRARYSELFDIDKDGNVSVKDHTVIYLQTYLTELDNEDDNAQYSNKSGRSKEHGPIFQDAEVALIKRVVKTHLNSVFGGDDIFEKFAFEEYLYSKLPPAIDDQNERPLIRMKTYQEGHLKLLKACMTVICEHSEERGNEQGPLMAYSCQNFPSHIESIIFDDVDAKIHQDLAQQLIQLLREPSLIDAWMTGWTPTFTRFSWFRSEGLTRMYDMLKDPVVLKGLRYMPDEKEWLAANTSSDGPSVRILFDVAKQLVTRWYEQKEDEWYELFYWLVDFKLCFTGKKPEGYGLPPASQINDLETFAKDQAGITGVEAEWHYCVARTLAYCRHFAEAMVRYERAVQLEPGNWKFRFGLCEALKDDNKPKDAIGHLEKLIEDNQAHINAEAENEIKTAYWTSILRSLADAYKDDRQSEKADESNWIILNKAFSEGKFTESAKDVVNLLLASYDEQGKHSAILELLQRLSDRADDEGNLGTWMCAFLHYNADVSYFIDRMHAAIYRQRGLVDFVKEQYEKAIAVALKSTDTFGTYIYLRNRLASLLWLQRGDIERDAALKIWHDALHTQIPHSLDPSSFEVGYSRRATFENLAQALLEKAKAAGLSTPLNPVAQSCVKQLEALETLIKKEEDTIVHGYLDVKLLLARVHHLAGNDTLARKLVRDYLKTAVRKAQEKQRYWAGWFNLARTFTVFDDDKNALACVNVTEVQIAPLDDEDFAVARACFDENFAILNGESTPATKPPISDADEVAAAVDEQQATAGAERLINGDSFNTASNSAATSDVKITESGSASGPAKEEKPEFVISQSCSGYCNRNWKEFGRTYICKDCAEVLFEETCYKKLLNGDLAICDPTHEFLEVPAFDMERWHRTPRDQMMVGNETIPIKQWFERIKKEWDLLPTPKERFADAIRKVVATIKLQKLSAPKAIARSKTMAL